LSDRPEARFIAIEGIDGAGTTTQTRLLADRLRERSLSVHSTAEPSAGEVGRLIRKGLGNLDQPLVPGTMALLFAADRLHHWSGEIEPALREGRWVITDRYVWSSLAYQSLDFPLEWVREINKYARRPDMTVLIDVDPSESLGRLEREGRDEEIYDRLDLQRRIRAHYKSLAETESEPSVVLDGSRPMERVSAEVWRAIEPLISRDGVEAT
jgi:dTMP kinase